MFKGGDKMVKSNVVSFSIQDKQKLEALKQYHKMGTSEFLVMLIDKAYKRMEREKCLQLKKS